MKKEFFVSGRTELAGNHTDHQNGRILGAAIDLGIRARVEKTEGDRIHLKTVGYGEIDVRPGQSVLRTREFGTPTALVRGVVQGFQELGLNVGGFDASVTSTLPAGQHPARRDRAQLFGGLRGSDRPDPQRAVQ